MKSPYLEIAVATPLRRAFHYHAPRGEMPPAGVRCRVPFGKRTVVGVVLGSTATPDVSPSKIRSINSILDAKPILPESIMKLCIWAAGYYHHPIGEVMATALPVLLRQGEAIQAPTSRLLALAGDTDPLGRAPRQRALYEQLQASNGLTSDALAQADMTRAVIKGLIDRGLAEWRTEDAPTPVPFDGNDLIAGAAPELNAEQATAVDAAASGTTLLYGVTGSGKTEVYLRVIESVIRAGKQALVLVPEISLTPQTLRRFTERFNAPLAALHSGMTDRERLDAWRRAASGEAAIVIGTRSAIFTPLKSPGVIVIDEEHDASFKQQDGFRYHARDLAVMRSQLEKIPTLMGSATPSLESWHNARQGRYQLATLSERAGSAKPPTFQLVNTRHEPMRDGFAESIIASIRRRLDAREQVLIFLNRRGFSPVLLCPDCTWVAECRRCDARMTLHHSTRSLICHHCGSTRPIDQHCPSCESKDLMPIGEGTQRVEAALTGLFPETPVIRIDRDSTRARYAMEKFMDQIRSNEPALLVGTQMIAKGHHFPNVTLVVIKDMDAAFFSANFKSPEKTGQLILQVGGRAGREQKPGTVAIETCVPHQPMFQQLIEDGYAAFADEMLRERREHALPPYHYQALLRAESVEKQTAIAFLDSIAGRLPDIPSAEVLGPVPASMERRAGRYRGQLLLSAPDRRPLHQLLRAAIDLAEADDLTRKVRWSVDVDPVDLF